MKENMNEFGYDYIGSNGCLIDSFEPLKRPSDPISETKASIGRLQSRRNDYKARRSTSYYNIKERKKTVKSYMNGLSFFMNPELSDKQMFAKKPNIRYSTIKTRVHKIQQFISMIIEHRTYSARMCSLSKDISELNQKLSVLEQKAMLASSEAKGLTLQKINESLSMIPHVDMVAQRLTRVTGSGGRPYAIIDMIIGEHKIRGGYSPHETPEQRKILSVDGVDRPSYRFSIAIPEHESANVLILFKNNDKYNRKQTRLWVSEGKLGCVLDRAYAEGAMHPHDMSSNSFGFATGKACLGSYKGLLLNSLKKNDIFSFFVTIADFLCSYNIEDTAGRRAPNSFMPQIKFQIESSRGSDEEIIQEVSSEKSNSQFDTNTLWTPEFYLTEGRIMNFISEFSGSVNVRLSASDYDWDRIYDEDGVLVESRVITLDHENPTYDLRDFLDYNGQVYGEGNVSAVSDNHHDFSVQVNWGGVRS